MLSLRPGFILKKAFEKKETSPKPPPQPNPTQPNPTQKHPLFPKHLPQNIHPTPHPLCTPGQTLNSGEEGSNEFSLAISESITSTGSASSPGAKRGETGETGKSSGFA